MSPDPDSRACPDENSLQELLTGRLPLEKASELQEHLADCEGCRKAVAALVKVTATPTEGAPPAPSRREPGPSRGSEVGRYVLVDRIGSGGMGVVYSAFDPELRRAVAVKLLRPGIAEAEGRRRLVREAQAMARLSHPNVIAVYDVGLHEDRVFITMELLAGGTARNLPGRSVREVLEVYLAAGRGLAHAHAAGIVHRDFKPGNVLVGADGRVCVADFGLAGELSAPEPSTPSSDLDLASDERITATGAVVGTPAYLAPEVRAGAPADAASDQFSFCVATYEGLYGQAPFAKSTAAARREVLPPPRGAKVPGRVRKALLRGLSPDPAARFPSMQALLDALSYRPEVVRRRAWVGALAAAAVAATAFGAVNERARRAALCQGAEPRFAEVWSPKQSAALSQAFMATGTTGAREAGLAVAERLDALGRGYAAAWRGACEATRVRGEQSEELLDLRMICLERWRQRVGAVIELLEKPDPALVSHAMDAVESVPRVDACADVEALTQRVHPPDDPAARARLTSLQQEQARLDALMAVGKWPENLARTEGLVEASVAAGYRPLESEARLLLARMQQLDGASEAAEASAHAALVAALAGRDSADSLRAFSYLAWLSAWSHRSAEADQYIAQTMALLEASPALPEDEGYAVLNVGRAQQAMDRHEQARTLFVRARAVARRLDPPDTTFEERVTFSLANSLMQLHRYDEALAEYQDAKTMLERAHGEPLAVAPVLVGIGAARLAQGRYTEAAALSRQALETEERELGPKNARLVFPLVNLCWALLDQGNDEAALPLIERAESLLDPKWTRAYDQAEVAFLHASALWGLGRERPHALELARSALAGYQRESDEVDAAKVEAWLATRQAQRGGRPP